MRTEIERAVGPAAAPAATSVFLGGGTPSLVPPVSSWRCSPRSPMAEGAEVTVECNPDDVTAALPPPIARRA